MGYKLISKNGDFLPLLQKIAEAHPDEDVKFYKSAEGPMFKGILDYVKNPIDLDIQRDDLVIFDMVGAGETAEVLKKKNYTVFGGGHLNDLLELDRGYGEEFMQKYGIQTPPTIEFSTFEEAEAHIRSHPGVLYVFKPNGNLETDLTIVPQSWEGLVRSLPYIKSRVPEDITFELQEFVEGIEMSTEAWFNGTQFLKPINSTMEEKKFMVGNIGPNTGCMGNVVWAWDREISEFLYEYLFKALEEPLREAGYIGPLDINGIWNEDGIHGLEWTARFGYDAIQAYSLLFTEEIGEFMKNIETKDSMPVKVGEYALSIRVSIPPFPSEGKVHEVPVVIPEEISKKYKQNIFLSDVQVTADGLSCAGMDGYVFSVATTGKHLPQLLATALYIIEEIDVQGKQYRNDIGERVIAEKRQIERIFRKLMKESV